MNTYGTKAGDISYKLTFGMRCDPWKLAIVRMARDVDNMDISPRCLVSCDEAKLFHPSGRSSNQPGDVLLHLFCFPIERL